MYQPVSQAPRVPKRSHRNAPVQKYAPCSFIRVIGSFMPVIVTGLILVTYYPMVLLYSDRGIVGFFVLLVFHVLLGLLFTSYVQVCITDPGTVPDDWHEAVLKLENPPFKKCPRSGLFKPPRSHFCGVTKRLVLNMDHYCPWVNNCVGFFNRKFFVLFLVYTGISCIFVCIMILPEFITKNGSMSFVSKKRLLVAIEKTNQMNPVEDSMFQIMTLMALVIDGCFSLTLTIFAIAHIYMAMVNQTSIEGATQSRPFKLDTIRNLESVFGLNKWHWAIPIYFNGPHGDGVHWQLQNGEWVGVVEESQVVVINDIESNVELAPILS